MKNILMHENGNFVVEPTDDIIKIEGETYLDVDECEQLIDFLIEERHKIKRRLNQQKREQRNKMPLWERIFK